MIEKILCNTCYHSTVRDGKTYCNYYDKFMSRKECTKFDHDVYKWFEGTWDKPEAETKVVSTPKRISNKKPKGLEIRDKKLKKKAQKRTEIKPGQENVCRFVTIRYEVIERVSGKYKRTGNQVVNGLQIKNKVILPDGHYKMINSKSVKILKIYSQIPEWANDNLKHLYNGHSEKNQINTIGRSDTHDN